MTEARLDVDADTGEVQLRLHIDLLRNFDSPAAYRRFAASLPQQNHLAFYERLANGIELRQGDRRLPLDVRAAQPPTPFLPEAFDDPFAWPRVWIDLAGRGYDPSAPLQVRFTSGFVFEEPIALTQVRGSQRMSRWLISDQLGPMLPAALTGSPEAPTATMAQSQPGPPLLQTLWVGFRHILPAGIDHLMFLLSLVLLCQSLRSLVLLVTAFTIGHCLTLAIAALRLITVPTHLVEPLILLSISLYALLALRRMGTTRSQHLLPVAMIGLLHGLGFATAYANAFSAANEFDGAGWAQRPLAHLLSFNLGIELAQLLFVAAVYPFISRYRALLHRPLALMLIAAPLLWALATLQAQANRQSLHGRAHAQESTVSGLEQPERRLPARDEAQGAQQRDRSPHRREGGSTGDQRAVRIAGVQPRQQALPV